MAVSSDDKSVRHDRHRRAFRVAAVVGAVLLILVVAEGVLRLTAQEEAPVKVQPVDADSLMNPLGLRDRCDAVPQHSDVLRIAFLGDSFTYGLGVEREQTFVRRTGMILRDGWPRPCVAVNLGRPGVDLISAWAVLNQVWDSVRPQVVVHVLSQDDLDVDVYEEGRAVETYLTSRTWAARHSSLVNLAETSFRWWRAYPRMVDHMRGGLTPALRERAWKIAEFQIQATQRLVAEGGGLYVLVRFPCLRWARQQDYPLAEVHRKTADLAARLKAPYLDLWESFRGKDPAALCLTRIDDHPTPAGHQIAAEAIGAFLIREILPKIRPGVTSAPASARSPQSVAEAEVRQYQRILELDPTCKSARFWLDRALNPRRGN